MTKLTNPVPLWLNATGDLLDGGSIYIGLAGQDPEANPIPVYLDDGFVTPINQPLRTQGGAIVVNGARAFVFVNAADYSVRVRDIDGNVVDFIPSARDAEPAYQPLDSDLTAIAALATTAFGRSLLTAANAAGLRTLAEITPFTGGSVTTNIVRQGAGPHLYWADSELTSGRVFQTAAGASDPTTQPGDLWLERAP